MKELWSFKRIGFKTAGNIIANVYLLGGATSVIGKEALWQESLIVVSGEIYNFYSKKDFVLKWLYYGKSFKSKAIGAGPANLDRVIDVNVTD